MDMSEVDYSTYLLELLDAEDITDIHSNYSLDDFLNVALDYQQEDHWFQPPEELCLVLFFIFFLLLGLVGNGLVCFIIVRRGRRQSSRNWYILNLAVSDILTCVLCEPLTLVRLVLKNWALGAAMCKLVPSLQTVYVFVSTLTLVALAVDRYRAVTCATHYERGVGVSRFLGPGYCLGLIWFASLTIALPVFVVHRLEEVKGFGGYVLYTVCLEQWNSQASLTMYTVFVLLMQYLSPLAAIVVLHLLIGKFLRMRIVAEGSCSSRMADPQWRRKRSRHRKNMVMLISMAVAFAVAWLPLHVITALASFDYHMMEHSNFPLLHACCMLVAYSSVCLNPLIYGILNSNFRRDLLRLWRRTVRRGEGGGGEGHLPPCSTSRCQLLLTRTGSGVLLGRQHTENCGLLAAANTKVTASQLELSNSAMTLRYSKDGVSCV